jgi:hypothetical protein
MDSRDRRFALPLKKEGFSGIQRRYFDGNPSLCSKKGIVSPCTTMEKATTPKVTTTIS